MTNVFFTKNVGEPWLNFSVASGNARQSLRTRARIAAFFIRPAWTRERLRFNGAVWNDGGRAGASRRPAGGA